MLEAKSFCRRESLTRVSIEVQTFINISVLLEKVSKLPNIKETLKPLPCIISEKRVPKSENIRKRKFL